MALITLTTDFGHKDYFVSAVKGAIYNLLPDVNLVDISHEILPFNVKETAYILKNTYKNFPENTIHIIGVDAEKTPERNHLALYLDGQYFICADNGIMSLIATEIKPSKIVEINIHNRLKTNFPILDVFINVACHIARGGNLDVIGKPINDIFQIKELAPKIVSQQKIIGHVLYIDHYGNAISNISKTLLNEIAKGRAFKIYAGSYTFNKVLDTYSNIEDFKIDKEKRYNMQGEKLALFNAGNYLEIAIYKSNTQTVGGASTLLGLGLGSIVSIEFLEE